MKLYAGIDLHSTNSYVVLADETDKIIYQKRLANDWSLLEAELRVYQSQIEGVVIESTPNWYWLVDKLQAEGYKVYLANTAALNQFKGLKYTDDKTDAIWLAKLLRMNILEQGYIYPKGERGLRELLRKRIDLVQEQTRFLLRLLGLFSRYENIRLSGDRIKKSEDTELVSQLSDPNVKLVAQSELKVLRCLMLEIEVLEKTILKQIRERAEFKLLQTLPGVGPILAMTILLEAGDIKRFAQVGDYSSYCRCVESKRLSNGKKKGENNRKNGNAYLGWSYVEATNFAIRSYEPIKKYYQRKLAKTQRVVAIKAIANKLARASYFVLRNQEVFDMKKAFG